MRRVGKLLIEICRCESSCIDFLIRQCIGERLGEEACATTEESVCFKVDDVLKEWAVVFCIDGFKDALLPRQSVDGVGTQHGEERRQ